MNVSTKIAPAAAQRLIEEQFVHGDLSVEEIRPTQNLVRGRRIADILVEMGKLSIDQVEQIIETQSINGGSFGRNALKLHMASPQDLQIAIGVEAGFLRSDPPPAKISAGLIVARNPYAKDADKFRVLRTRLTTGVAAEKNAAFAITGAHGGAAAEFVAANIAASLAQIGRRVLLIDANLRSSGLAAYFGDGATAGLSELLAGRATAPEMTQRTIVKNLDIIPAGEKTLEPQMLLSQEALGALVAAMRGAYDHLVVVTADFGLRGDSEFVWSAVGHVVIVAKRNIARSDDLKKLHSVMRNTSAEIIGAVMTG